MRQRFGLLLLLILLGLPCAYAFWVKVVEPAREAARRSACENKLFQHTGWHPPVVELDKDLQVVKVAAACPLCIWYAPPAYHLPEKGQWFKREEIPRSTIVRAESLLDELKRARPYSDHRPPSDQQGQLAKLPAAEE